MQIPQVECPDGTWLVDTTPTIAYLETIVPEPRITPRDPILRFVSLLLEDYADEWLWRPAMHYRWSYAESARLMSGRLAEHLSDQPGPLFVKKLYWRVRQTAVFVRRDGVTRATRAAVEASYLDTLAALEAIFRERPFVLGQRPTEADFGFFASMFRHFFCDPTSGRLMRARAPAVHEWVARMWSLTPERVASAPEVDEIPQGLEPLLAAVVEIYLPYLLANARAYAGGASKVRYGGQGVRWSEPVKPYRVWCLQRLRDEFCAFGDAERRRVLALLGGDGTVAEALQGQRLTRVPEGLGTLPIRVGERRRARDSWWRSR
jgi:glutathione S-transferase